MRVIGIDPGYDRLGVAIMDKNFLLHSACLTTQRGSPFGERLYLLIEEVEKLIKKWKPDTLGMEKVYFKSNQKTAMGVAEVRGAIIYLAGKHRLSLTEYAPAQIKSALTGHGRADKNQVAKMVENLLKMKKKPKYDDEYDAIAVALTCFAHQGLAKIF